MSKLINFTDHQNPPEHPKFPQDFDDVMDELEDERLEDLEEMRLMRAKGKSEREIWEQLSIFGNITVYDLELDTMTLEEKIALAACDGINASDIFTEDELQRITVKNETFEGKIPDPTKFRRHEIISENARKIASKCEDAVDVQIEEISKSNRNVSIRITVKNNGVFRHHAKSALFTIIPVADEVSFSNTDDGAIQITFTVMDVWKPELTSNPT